MRSPPPSSPHPVREVRGLIAATVRTLCTAQVEDAVAGSNFRRGGWVGACGPLLFSSLLARSRSFFSSLALCDRDACGSQPQCFLAFGAPSVAKLQQQQQRQQGGVGWGCGWGWVAVRLTLSTPAAYVCCQNDGFPVAIAGGLAVVCDSAARHAGPLSYMHHRGISPVTVVVI